MNETVAQLKEYMKKFQQYQTIESLLSSGIFDYDT